MKVCELIEKLQKMDPNAIVHFEDNNWYCSEILVARQDTCANGENIVVVACE